MFISVHLWFENACRAQWPERPAPEFSSMVVPASGMEG